MRDDRELTLSVQRNPWARAVWERKHSSGPVLVIWHMAPLALYVAGWIKFAGNRCMPALVAFDFVDDGTTADTIMERLGEESFAVGPSAKMIEQSKRITESYVARGKRGGRPKKKKRPDESEADSQTIHSTASKYEPGSVPAVLAQGIAHDPHEWEWIELKDVDVGEPGYGWILRSREFDATIMIGMSDDMEFYVRRQWRDDSGFHEDWPLRTKSLKACLAIMEEIAARAPSTWRVGDSKQSRSPSN